MSTPSTRQYWYSLVAYLLLVIGTIDLVLYVIKGMNGLFGSLSHIQAPSSSELDLPEPGTYTIFAEASSRGGEPQGRAHLTLTSKATGAEVPLTKSAGAYTYVWDGRVGVSVLDFEIEESGAYEVIAQTSEPLKHGRTFSIGYNWEDRMSKMFASAATGMLIWVTAAAVIAVVPIVRRPRTRAASPDAMARSSAPLPVIHRLRFHGTAIELLGIFLVNVLFTLITVGIYTFWAKVRTRKFLWSQTEFADDRLAFHGTGKELLIGWVKAGILFGGFASLTTILPMLWNDPMAPMVGRLLFIAAVMILVPLAIVGAMRYRLSRTSWRGIRFTFRGGYGPFLWVSLRGLLLTAITVGLYYPLYQTSIRRYLASHSAFGTASFGFEGNGKELVSPFVLAVIFTIPTVGLIWIWYVAQQRRYYWNHTSFVGAQFHSTVTARGLFALYLTNLLLIVITLGLAIPWATVRAKRYDLDNLVLRGVLDLEGITQQAQAAAPAADELAGLLDVDALPG